MLAVLGVQALREAPLEGQLRGRQEPERGRLPQAGAARTRVIAKCRLLCPVPSIHAMDTEHKQGRAGCRQQATACLDPPLHVFKA